MFRFKVNCESCGSVYISRAVPVSGPTRCEICGARVQHVPEVDPERLVNDGWRLPSRESEAVGLVEDVFGRVEVEPVRRPFEPV